MRIVAVIRKLTKSDVLYVAVWAIFIASTAAFGMFAVNMIVKWSASL
jgi:hypothetical protein